MSTSTAPRVSGGDELVYVYGVVDGEALTMEQVPQLQGIVPKVPVELLRAGNFAVVVSRALAREVFDTPDTSTEVARNSAIDRALAHHRVLSSLAALYTVAPVKYGALCRGMDDILALFDRHGGAFEQALVRVAGAREWGVKLFADRVAARAAAGDAPPVAALGAALTMASPGKAFFLRKKMQTAIDMEMQAAFGHLANDVYVLLASHAREVIPSPAQRLAPMSADGKDPLLILDAAYLVDRTHEDSFQRTVTALADEIGARGGILKLTGPWPPYSFASIDTAEKTDG